MSGRRVEIGLVPLGAFGLTAFGVDLYFARHGMATVRGVDWLTFLHGAGSWRVVADLVLIGVFAGFYRSEEHTSELQSLMRISYAVFCLKKKKKISST